MLGQVSSRIGAAAVVVLGVCTLVFALIHLIPGDPVEAMLGDTARPADRDALREALGLNLSLGEQYRRYMAGLLRLDLGHSFLDGRPVSAILAERLPATAQLAGAALLLALLLALPLGMLAALRRGGPLDSGAMAFSLIGISIPNFWLGPLLILVFSLWLGWTPVSGNESAFGLVLPALTLGTAMAAILARMVRASVLEVLAEDYVRTARAKGVSELRILWRHAMRNAWLPVLTLIGLQLGGLLGGAVITETVFAWPGVGSLLVESIQARDFPVVQGCVLLISLIYVAVNTLTDLAYAWVDPRVARR
ncbi:MAG: ABC transporter permease [Thiohalocapsa sp.]|nr:ABC transporter permease [Thiohalocapsa sp.]